MSTTNNMIEVNQCYPENTSKKNEGIAEQGMKKRERRGKERTSGTVR